VSLVNIRKMTRQEIALHSLQAEFMHDAEPGEWYELPGGTHEGCRMPDHADELGNTWTGCWFARPVETDIDRRDTA
jgi:hypothetical protein